mgnify:CR=1 FL=1
METSRICEWCNGDQRTLPMGMCKMHQAAPAMFEALKKLIVAIDRFRERMAPIQECEPGSLGASEHHELSVAESQARAALAEAGEP